MERSSASLYNTCFTKGCLIEEVPSIECDEPPDSFISSNGYCTLNGETSFNASNNWDVFGVGSDAVVDVETTRLSENDFDDDDSDRDEEGSDDSDFQSYYTRKTFIPCAKFRSFSSSSSIPVKLSATEKPIKRKPRLTVLEEIPGLSYELQNGYNVLRYLMSTANKIYNKYFLDAFDEESSDYKDYCRVIKRPMWLSKVKSKLLEGRYQNITEVIRDIRLIMENCYRYYGPKHSISKKALKLETLLNQKLQLLPRELKEKTSLEATSSELVACESKDTLKTWNPRHGASSSDSSRILNCVRHEKALRDREARRKYIEDKKAEKVAEYEEVLNWERKLLADDETTMKSMWELPQIGYFLFLAQKALKIPEIPQYTLERMFLMPRESVTLAIVMTALLSAPQHRGHLGHVPPMPYKIWHERLKLKLHSWLKVFKGKENDTVKVFNSIGVEPDFFAIFGHSNPLTEKSYHELTFYQKVWIIKSLCDYVMHNHKSVQEVVGERSLIEQKAIFLGEDKKGNTYLHFPQFCGQDLRVYRQAFCSGLPVLTATKSHKKSKKFNPVPQPDVAKFQLIADKVDDLRHLIANFQNSTEEVSTRKKKGPNLIKTQNQANLVKRFLNLLKELEPWEVKLQQAAKKQRLQMKKDWDDYHAEAPQHQEDISVWENASDDELSHLSKSSTEKENVSTKESCASPGFVDSNSAHTNEFHNKRKSQDSDSENDSSSSGRSMGIKNHPIKKRKLDNREDYNSSEKKSQTVTSTMTTDAQGQYYWETLRQIIVSSKKRKIEMESKCDTENSLISNALVENNKDFFDLSAEEDDLSDEETNLDAVSHATSSDDNMNDSSVLDTSDICKKDLLNQQNLGQNVIVNAEENSHNGQNILDDCLQKCEVNCTDTSSLELRNANASPSSTGSLSSEEVSDSLHYQENSRISYNDVLPSSSVTTSKTPTLAANQLYNTLDSSNIRFGNELQNKHPQISSQSQNTRLIPVVTQDGQKLFLKCVNTKPILERSVSAVSCSENMDVGLQEQVVEEGRNTRPKSSCKFNGFTPEASAIQNINQNTSFNIQEIQSSTDDAVRISGKTSVSSVCHNSEKSTTKSASFSLPQGQTNLSQLVTVTNNGKKLIFLLPKGTMPSPQTPSQSLIGSQPIRPQCSSTNDLDLSKRDLTKNSTTISIPPPLGPITSKTVGRLVLKRNEPVINEALSALKVPSTPPPLAVMPNILPKSPNIHHAESLNNSNKNFIQQNISTNLDTQQYLCLKSHQGDSNVIQQQSPINNTMQSAISSSLKKCNILPPNTPSVRLKSVILQPPPFPNNQQTTNNSVRMLILSNTTNSASTQSHNSLASQNVYLAPNILSSYHQTGTVSVIPRTLISSPESQHLPVLQNVVINIPGNSNSLAAVSGNTLSSTSPQTSMLSVPHQSTIILNRESVSSNQSSLLLLNNKEQVFLSSQKNSN